MEILVLGNGFDLAHVLPTSYHCFLTVTRIVSNLFLLDNLTIGRIFTEAQSICPTIKKSYVKYKTVYDDCNLDVSVVSDYINACRDNMWLKYFWQSSNEKDGWIDFEKDIGQAIEVIDEFLKKDCQSLRFSLRGKRGAIIHCFPFFYYSPDGSNVQGDYKFIERKKLTIKNEYVHTDVLAESQSPNRERIAKEMYDSLIEFSELLDQYFKLFVEEPLTRIKEAKLIDLDDNYSRFDFVVSYNYTKTYELLYGNEGVDVSHIHGSLGNRIILGINSDKNDEIDGDLTFIDFKKYYQRVVYGTDLDYIRQLYLMKQYPNDEITVSVVGHSLDVTDKDSLEELFNIANYIIIYYHDKDKISQFVQNLIKLFGKQKFDELRYEKELQFLPQDGLRVQETVFPEFYSYE